MKELLSNVGSGGGAPAAGGSAPAAAGGAAPEAAAKVEEKVVEKEEESDDDMVRIHCFRVLDVSADKYVCAPGLRSLRLVTLPHSFCPSPLHCILYSASTSKYS